MAKKMTGTELQVSGQTTGKMIAEMRCRYRVYRRGNGYIDVMVRVHPEAMEEQTVARLEDDAGLVEADRALVVAARHLIGGHGHWLDDGIVDAALSAVHRGRDRDWLERAKGDVVAWFDAELERAPVIA